MTRRWTSSLTLAVLAGSLVAACSDNTVAPSAAAPSATPRPIQIVAEFTRGGVPVGGGGTSYVGQSVTVPSGQFNGLRFFWQRRAATGIVPVAMGRLFLFNQEYQGPIADMGPSALGFVAVSAPATSDEYVFPEAVTVQSGAKYWFYSEALASDFLSTDAGLGDQYQGGDQYAPGPGPGWVRAIVSGTTDRLDANFVLRGRPVQ